MIPLRDSQPSHTFPAVTVTLIAVNVAVFLFEFSLDPRSFNAFVEQYAMIPEEIRPSTLVTSMFLHGGFMHILGNMWFLWIFGDNVEDILGKGRYLLFYVACGVAAALLQFAINPDSRVPTVGASGAIAGVMGAYMLKFPRSRIRTLIFLFVFIQVVEIPAVWVLVYWFVIQFFSGVSEIGRQSMSEGGVAWFAHVGGFLAGMALVSVMKTRERNRNYSGYYR
jgi:membrane associated rhomboid family serine protease